MIPGRTLRVRGKLSAAGALMSAILAVPGGVIWAQAAAAPAAAVHAKGDIEGDWQGTLEVQKSLRIIARIAKADKGGWSAKFYSIDQTPQPFAASAVTVDSNTVKFTVDLIGGSYTGTLSADGNTISGMWSQGATPNPLTLVRATKETVWEIPTPVPVKRMAADADPAFDVATIKPNESGGSTMQQLTLNGRNFVAKNASVGDLISFAYDVQKKQIVGAPDWLDMARFDIAAVPNQEGVPSLVQLRVMIQKLLKDRFQLAFHKDKREMPAYVLTVTKTGQKMTKDESGGPLPGFGLRPTVSGVMVPVMNASMSDFAGVLQSMVLDRPVVNETSLEGKFDFTLKFTPDDSQFNGHPPQLPNKDDAAKADVVEASPNLFDAIQQQIGLKLDAQKTPVDVIAVDRLERPSAN